MYYWLHLTENLLTLTRHFTEPSVHRTGSWPKWQLTETAVHRSGSWPKQQFTEVAVDRNGSSPKQHFTETAVDRKSLTTGTSPKQQFTEAAVHRSGSWPKIVYNSVCATHSTLLAVHISAVAPLYTYWYDIAGIQWYCEFFLLFLLSVCNLKWYWCVRGVKVNRGQTKVFLFTSFLII
jgi:hypothetical protein